MTTKVTLFGGAGGGAGKRFATIVVAASDSKDTTAAHYDFLCTGTNDETTLTNAIAALPTEGGKVLLMEGHYNLKASVATRSNLVIEGMGPGVTVVQFVAGAAANDALFGNSADQNFIRIANLTLDGGFLVLGAGTPEGGLDFKKVTNLWVDNVVFQNCGNAGLRVNPSVNPASDILISGCIFNNCFATAGFSGALQFFSTSRLRIVNTDVFTVVGAGVVQTAHGFYLDTVSESSIANCQATLCNNQGFNLVNCSGVTVVGCVSYANFGGFYLNNCARCLIADSIGHGNKLQTGDASNGNGFVIGSSQFCSVTGCVAFLNGEAGVMLFNANTDCLVADCICDSNSQDTNLNVANIYVRTNMTNCTLRGNTCRVGTQANKPTYGIDISAASDSGTLVINNDLHTGGATGAYHDAGTGTITNLDGSANNWNRL